MELQRNFKQSYFLEVHTVCYALTGNSHWRFEWKLKNKFLFLWGRKKSKPGAYYLLNLSTHQLLSNSG